MSADSRTWSQKLADGAPYVGLLIAVSGPAWIYGITPTPPWMVMFAVSATLTAIGVERTAHYRGQRDRHRRALVALVRRCDMDQQRSYFEDLVPADVLDEALPSVTASIGGQIYREDQDV